MNFLRYPLALLAALTFVVSSISSLRLHAADTLTIVHINDTHSFLAPGGRRSADLNGSIGGMARAASIIGSIEMQEKNVLPLHAGDLFIGDLFFQRSFGVAEIQLLQALGFRAMTLGNHEFDLTPAVLQQAFDTAFAGGQSMQVLSANLLIPQDSFPHLRKLVQPYTICDVNGIKVGVFGLTTPATNMISLPSPAFLDTNIVEIATNMVSTLRGKGCSVVICLSHLGVSLDRAVASYVDGIDLIVGGHDHYLFAHPIMVKNVASGRETPIVQASSFYHNVGEVQLLIDDAKHVSVLTARVIPVNESVPEEPQIKAVVDGLIADIEKTYGAVFSQKVAEADDDCEEVVRLPLEAGPQDTPIGNLVSDAYRAFGKADIGIQPSGSTAEQLYKGPLVADDIFRVSGYGFNLTNGLGYRMMVCTLTGAEIAAGLEFGLADIENSDDFMLQCSGLNYHYNAAAAPLARLLSASVNGKALDMQKDYTVCVNEFVVAFLQFLNTQPRNLHVFGDTTEFQVLEAYCAAMQHVHPLQEGRIIADKLSEVRGTDGSSIQSPIQSVQCAPNPADSFCAATIDKLQGTDVRAEIFDTHLRLVSSACFDASTASSQPLVLKTSALASGTYFVKWIMSGETRLSVLNVVH